MARKRSFVWTYLEEDGHLRRYAHDSCLSTQGCHVGRKKRRTDAIKDWGEGEGKASDRKDRKRQELRKAGIVTTRIQQQSRCTTFRRSEAEGQEQRGQSWAKVEKSSVWILMDRSWLRVVKSFKEHRWTRPGATREA